ncbi:hypothetical protein BKA62DRAFT_771614 [Auriculariales sp. MPI-PUGE-AT-0066]|nr:hypothetical protein BKA62DRAFT_771614 [Auriculariales sp. MPI-PUGE-AT-0066]
MSRLISEQLTPALSMSLKPGSPPRSSGCNHSSGHCSHMHSRARTRIFAGVVLLLTVTIILALSVSNPGVAAHAFVKGGWSDGSLLRRAVSDSGSSNSDSPFIKNKLYLIVIIVGLFHASSVSAVDFALTQLINSDNVLEG